MPRTTHACARTHWRGWAGALSRGNRGKQNTPCPEPKKTTKPSIIHSLEAHHDDRHVVGRPDLLRRRRQRLGDGPAARVPRRRAQLGDRGVVEAAAAAALLLGEKAVRGDDDEVVGGGELEVGGEGLGGDAEAARVVVAAGVDALELQGACVCVCFVCSVCLVVG